MRFVTRCLLFFFCKQKTAYELRISDWSSDVCSSGLLQIDGRNLGIRRSRRRRNGRRRSGQGRDLLRLGSSLGLGSEPRLFGRLGFGREPRFFGSLGLGSKPRFFGHLGLGGKPCLFKIGSASCRERVCQYVSISLVAGCLKK